MYCLHCKYTTKLRNDKEINALFASATHGGAAVSAAPTKQTCTNITILPQIAKNFWRKIFSHRLHRLTQIRRVWHPAIPTQPPNYLPTEFTEHTETTGGEEKSVNSVKSVGGSSTPEASVYSAFYVKIQMF